MKQIEITALEQLDGSIKILDFKNCLEEKEIKEKYPLYLDYNVFAFNYDVDGNKWIGIFAKGYSNELQYRLRIGGSYSKEYFNECIRLLKIAGENFSWAKRRQPLTIKI